MNNEEEEETVCIKCGDIAKPGKQLDQIGGRKGTKSVNISLDTLIGYAEKLNLPTLAESLQKNEEINKVTFIHNQYRTELKEMVLVKDFPRLNM